MKVKNPVYQTIRIFLKINQKRDFQKRKVQVSLKYVDFCTQDLAGV